VAGKFRLKKPQKTAEKTLEGAAIIPRNLTKLAEIRQHLCLAPRVLVPATMARLGRIGLRLKQISDKKYVVLG
jgi:hypothetical protein